MEQNKSCPAFDFAQLDHERPERNGFMEVIYSPGKEAGQLAQIFQEFYQKHGRVLATRASQEQYEAVISLLPEAKFYSLASVIYLGFDLGEIWSQDKADKQIDFKNSSHTNLDFVPSDRGQEQDNIQIRKKNEDESAKKTNYKIALISAGTADLAVSEEAYASLALAGIYAERFYDLGVAGLHRLLGKIEQIREVDVIIVIAGMDGALASVVAGLVPQPVIAVPTSVGYGANFQGLAPLLTMLNSCAAGVTVVNIDNGYGAAMAALRIINLNN